MMNLQIKPMLSIMHVKIYPKFPSRWTWKCVIATESASMYASFSTLIKSSGREPMIGDRWL